MDTFANLKWNSNISASNSNQSSRTNSKPGTPVPGTTSGFDSFASLTPMATGSKKSKNLESLSLLERQNILKERNGNDTNGSESSQGPSAWSGLDLLSGGIGSSERLGKIISSSTVEKSGTVGSTSNSLLDGFDDIPVKDVISSTSTAPETDNIDDLFAVFNQPKVEKKEDDVVEKKQHDDESKPESSSENELEGGIQLEHDDHDTEYNDDYNDYDNYSAESRVFTRNGRREDSHRSESRSDSRVASRGGSSTPSSIRSHIPPTPDPRDGAIAELMDMGFTDEQAIYALAQTNTGLDIRQAVDVLMFEAHQRATGQPPTSKPSSSRRRQKEAPIEDISKLASEFSTQFISKAGSLWNMSRKNIAKAIEQYNSQPLGNDGTPAWMKEAQRYAGGEDDEPTVPPIHLDSDSDASIRRGRSDGGRNHARGNGGRNDNHVFRDSDFTDDDTPPPIPPVQTTDEALMLESDGPRNRRKPASHPQQAPTPPPSRRYVPDADVQPIRRPQAVPVPPSASPQPTLSRAQLLRERQKEMKEEDSMYVSSSRRRTPTPRLGTPNPPSRQSSRAATPNLPATSNRISTPKTQTSRVSTPKPSIPPREIIPISSSALTMASTAREQGTEAFKRGDFTQAITYYSQALESIPPRYILQTIILTNRSTCYLKCGDAKSALSDAEQSITIIGPGLGAGEEAEPNKPLKDIWSKAVARRAEAYEHLEKFQNALDSWTLLITNGYSSKQSMDGKRRCQEALSPKPKPKPTPTSTPVNDGPHSAAGIAALQKVKEAHANAEKVDSERYALHDTVNNRIENWRHGKEDNLRALLGSLDNILWTESGWKKVSLADLVVPKKVKLVYMKAAAKTHPDKISSNATTEQKMIAEGVFITLNKAWDQFKVTNGLS